MRIVRLKIEQAGGEPFWPLRKRHYGFPPTLPVISLRHESFGGTVGLKRKIAFALVLVMAAVSNVLADSCPLSFRQFPPEDAAEGGVFYVPNDAPYARLAGSEVSFKGRSLNLFFVPRAGLCEAAATGSRDPDCGDRGFLLVKTVKDTGAIPDGKVTLMHGDEFALESGFSPTTVNLTNYQAFHRDTEARVGRIRDQWHQEFKVGDKMHRTYEPLGKRLQFTIDEGEDALKGWTVARLIRFRPPEVGEVVCVPFSVDWTTADMKLQLDLMIAEPVLDGLSFDPASFRVTRRK